MSNILSSNPHPRSSLIGFDWCHTKFHRYYSFVSKRRKTICQAADTRSFQTHTSKRHALFGLIACSMSLPLEDFSLKVADAAEMVISEPVIRVELTPDQSLYDANDPEIRRAASMIQSALNASTVEEEDTIWTEIISEFEGNGKPWSDDVVGRAFGNRGNCRSRQGRLEAALNDYNAAITKCPWSVDPVLNRGVALESLGRFEDAKRDYLAVLRVSPDDPGAWNNLGNACAGTNDFASAVKYYDKASRLAPKFAFALANKAVSLYQIGEEDVAIREMESLLRKYPDFADMRAALASALWIKGNQAAAEEAFQRVDDIRYKSVDWLKNERRWPPKLIQGIADYISINNLRVNPKPR